MARAPSITGVAGGGSGTDPTLSSTLGDTVDTTSPYSFAPTLTSDGTLVTTITRASDTSSVSVTGLTTTTPTATLTAADAALGDSFHCETVATKDGLTNTLVTTVFMEGTGGGGWSTIHSVDFTSDITDLTLTKGAGNTNLRNAANDATKAVVGYADRTPTTVSTAVITAAAGKFLLTSNSGGAATESAFVYTELTEGGTGVDWSDRSKTYAIDIVASSLGWGSNGDVVFIGIGTSASGINSGSWFGVRLDRDGGTDFVDAGRRYLGSGENGANQNASASAITSRAIRIIVSGGVIADVYWQAGTTPLEGFPTVSGSVFKSFEGNRALGIEASPETTLGATFYVIAEALSTSGSNVVVGIEQIRIQEFS